MREDAKSTVRYRPLICAGGAKRKSRLISSDCHLYDQHYRKFEPKEKIKCEPGQQLSSGSEMCSVQVLISGGEGAEDEGDGRVRVESNFLLRVDQS